MSLKRLTLPLLASCLAACASSTPSPARCTDPEVAREAPQTATPEPAPAPSASAPPVVAVPYDFPKSSDFAPPAVDLPHAASAESMPMVLGVEITKDGKVIVAGRVVDKLDDVTRIAREAHDRDPDVRAVIRADRNATWGTVVRVMDLLKQGNVAKIAFAVEANAP